MGSIDNKEYWSMTEGVFNCLIDEDRTAAFRNAILNTVKEGDVVVDMGAGSGVLAMFAAQAGAKKIYAVELDQNNIKTLNETFRVNGFSNYITVVEGDVTTVQLPEKVDVIIGEMIATGLIEELQIPAMNNVLNFAKRHVKVVLKEFHNFIDLVYSANVWYGKKFPILRYEYPDLKQLSSEAFSDKFLYKKVDFTKVNQNNAIRESVLLKVNRDGEINGIRISSKSIFYDNSSFDASFAYSYPIILPINETRVVRGDQFLVNINYVMCQGIKNLQYSIEKK